MPETETTTEIGEAKEAYDEALEALGSPPTEAQKFALVNALQALIEAIDAQPESEDTDSDTETRANRSAYTQSLTSYKQQLQQVEQVAVGGTEKYYEIYVPNYTPMPQVDGPNDTRVPAVTTIDGALDSYLRIGYPQT